MTIQNDLLLRKLAREQTSRPPIWFMRQAGRYAPLGAADTYVGEIYQIFEKYRLFAGLG